MISKRCMNRFILVVMMLSGMLSTSYAATVLPDNNTKNEGGTVTLYDSTIPGYYKFIDVRYGFSIDFPRSFNRASMPTNGDGGTFSLSDGTAALSAWGGHNALDQTVEDVYQQVIKSAGGDIAYAVQEDDWYVVSWKTGGVITYEKGFVSAKYRNGFRLSYPESRKSEFNSIVENVNRSFVPGWKTGYKIWG